MLVTKSADLNKARNELSIGMTAVADMP